MAMIPTYDHIINCVRSSNLNFSYQETPFSLYFTIRKSQVKYNNYQDNITSPTPSQVLDNPDMESLMKENLTLKEKLLELEVKLDASEETTKILEGKVSAAEADALKANEEIKKEKEKKEDNVTSKFEVEKENLDKVKKKKEKEALKIEKSNLAKNGPDRKIKYTEKGDKSGRKPLNKKDSNKNILPDMSPRSSSSSSPSRPIGLGSSPHSVISPPTNSTNATRNSPPRTPTRLVTALPGMPPSQHTPPGLPPPSSPSNPTLDQIKAAFSELSVDISSMADRLCDRFDQRVDEACKLPNQKL